VGCGGQVVPPKGYLERIAAIAKQNKALYIADEVQVGFGRVGTHFWGFEIDGVIPDIVTMGKPIGNGHPMAAVVTTREIAQAFHNGVEYFNTFGGNPVSCAVGLEVLRVIEEEHLQAHALRCGDHLMAGLRDLAKSHNLCSDVRGRGLFIGFELLQADGKTPDAARVKALHEGLRQAGFLLGIDGPDHNVLKIKPPLALGLEHADAMLSAFDQLLRDH
jgi:4-aminobutyrate aminotransferase-like enzyme